MSKALAIAKMDVGNYFEPNLVSRAVARSVQMTVAASGSGGIAVLDDADINPGIHHMFFHWEGVLPDWTPSGNVYLMIKEQTGVSELYLRINLTTGLITTSLITSSVTRFTGSSPAPSFVDGRRVKITAVVVRETPSTAGSITYYINGKPWGAAIAIPAGTPVSATNTGKLVVCGTEAGQRFASHTSLAIIGNYAPTAEQVMSLCVNGPALIDLMGASSAGVTVPNGTFETWGSSTNPNDWLEGASVSASISQVTGGGQYAGTYSLQFSGNGAPNVSFNNTIYQSYFGNSFLGKRVRIKIAAKRTAGSGSLFVGQGGTEYSTIATADGLSSSWVLFTIEKTITSNAGNASMIVLAAESGTTCQVDSYEVEVLGITGMWSAEDAQGDTGQILDSSGNGNHALLPAAGATVIPRRLSGEVRWTNTWAGTSELQYVCGTNQAVFTAASALTTIDIVASGSVTVNIGDGSSATKYGSAIALSAGKNRVTLATPFNDGTNLKLTITPTGAFTGTLKTTARYAVLEA